MSDKLAALIEGSAAPQRISDDRLAAIRGKVTEAYQLQLIISDLEEETKTKISDLNRLLNHDLPTMMAESMVPSLTIDKHGNYPALEIKTQPFYSAGIPASWTDEQKQEAFDWLDANGHGSLIKTIITIDIDREDRKKAQKVMALLKKNKVDFSVTQSVHRSTLTAWLKTQVEKVKKVPPLKVIGGVMGTVAKIKEVKP